MAFGKDPDQLANIPAYGGNAVQQAKALARRDIPPQGKGMPYWKSLFILPDTHSTIIRLIRGDYEQQVSFDKENIVTARLTHVRFIEHHNGKRGGICSGGPLWYRKGKSLECPSCGMYWEDKTAITNWKAAKKMGQLLPEPIKRMSATERFGYSMWDYGLYFQVPDIDGNGQVRMNPRTNQPYSNWVPGSPNDPHFQGYPWKNGNLLSWAMPFTYHETLLNLEKQKIGTCCATCGTVGSIQSVMRTCAFCGDFIYDPNQCQLTEEQRTAIDDYPHTCQKCGKTGFTTEQIRCGNCAKPVRATLFDVDLEVMKIGSKGKQTFVQVLSFSPPRPIQVQDPQILATIKPLNLLRKFSPTPPDVQRKMFGIGAVQALPQPQGQQHPAQGMQGMVPQAPPQLFPGMGGQPQQGQMPMGMGMGMQQPPAPSMSWQTPMVPQPPMQPGAFQGQQPQPQGMPWQPAMSMSQQPQAQPQLAAMPYAQPGPGMQMPMAPQMPPAMMAAGGATADEDEDDGTGTA